jgi:hypothetical protein
MIEVLGLARALGGGLVVSSTVERYLDDDDDDINLRPGGASETDIPRPPEGYRDVLS